MQHKNQKIPDINSWRLNANSHGTESIHCDCPGMVLKRAIKLWLSNKSEHTRSTYGQIITSWLSYLPLNKAFMPDTLDVYEFLDLLAQRPGQRTRLDLEGVMWPSTIRKYVTCLSSFYGFLISIGACERNPFKDPKFSLKHFRVDQKRPTEFIPFEKIQDIVDAAGLKPGKIRVRNRAILATLFGTGLRKSEARNLLMQDLRKTNAGTFYLHLRQTKNKKNPTPGLGEWALKYLLPYRKQRMEEDASDIDPLFIGYDQATQKPLKVRMSPKSLYLVMKYAAARAGVPLASFHSGRAVVVSRLRADGATHREVMAVTGHSSVQMVELYDKRTFGPDETASKDLEW